MAEILLTSKTLAQRLGISIRQLWRLRDSGTLPRPTSLGDGGRSLRWPESVVDEWIQCGAPDCRSTGWRPSSARGQAGRAAR
jgi:predicted DNA-binding transcriptional regulator AlpA